MLCCLYNHISFRDASMACDPHASLVLLSCVFVPAQRHTNSLLVLQALCIASHVSENTAGFCFALQDS